MRLSAFIAAALDTLLPEICGICSERCERGFCSACLARLPRIAQPCPACALPTDPATAHNCSCPNGVEALVAPFAFAPPLTSCIHALKYARRRSLGRALALAVIDTAGERLPAPAVWLPVPLHPVRLRSRTFNQAEEIALRLARWSGIAVAGNSVRRVRATEAQSTLPAARRHANLRDAFAVVRPVAGLDIALVDDVVTTGATLGALAVTLRAAGARRVTAVAIARTIPQYGADEAHVVRPVAAAP